LFFFHKFVLSFFLLLKFCFITTYSDFVGSKKRASFSKSAPSGFPIVHIAGYINNLRDFFGKYSFSGNQPVLAFFGRKCAENQHPRADFQHIYPFGCVDMGAPA